MASSSPVEYKQFSNRSIWPIDGTWTSITILDQSGPGGNGYERLLISLQGIGIQSTYSKPQQ